LCDVDEAVFHLVEKCGVIAGLLAYSQSVLLSIELLTYYYIIPLLMCANANFNEMHTRIEEVNRKEGDRELSIDD